MTASATAERAGPSRADGGSRCGPPRPRRDSGAATVLAVAVVAVVVLLSTGALVIASAVVASGRARLAADVAALAGARAARDGADAARACALARQVARTNEATLTACSLEGERLDVVVTVQPAWWPAVAAARSRAGPPS